MPPLPRARLPALLRLVRPDSIRNKILLFALAAALLPSLSTAWMAYQENRRSITDRVEGELTSSSEQAARATDLWLKERVHELRTFTGSYEITENIERAAGNAAATGRIREYLASLRRNVPEYVRLFVVDAQGRPVATTGDGTPPSLPPDELAGLGTANQLVTEPVWDSAARGPRATLVVPVRLAGGRMVGALGADTRFRSVAADLRKYAPGRAGRIYLATYGRRVVVASDTASPALLASTLPPATASRLFEREGRTVEYAGLDGSPVIGILRRVPGLDWALVAEVPTAEAFAQVRQLRNTAVLVLVGLVLGIGLIAYRLGLLIVRPLDRLTRGAAEVAGGDFTVDLPPAGGGEVGYLTEVFNDMVARLREGRARLGAAYDRLQRQNEELERLSITDGLTGLVNRRRLMETLTGEIERSRRLGHVCAVLMIDVDHFKRYNDAHGHQAGDDVLRGVGAALRESTREIDCAARYGGEEFFVLLPETGLDEAADVAERIRTSLKERIFLGGRITLSIGVALFPVHGDTPENVLAAADAALYQAKEKGRDRVVRAGGGHRNSGSHSQRGA